VNEEALACELAAHYYFEMGDAVKAMQHFTLAQKSIRSGERLESVMIYASSSPVILLQ
jgi:hypothetical protein